MKSKQKGTTLDFLSRTSDKNGTRRKNVFHDRYLIELSKYFKKQNI